MPSRNPASISHSLQMIHLCTVKLTRDRVRGKCIFIMPLYTESIHSTACTYIGVVTKSIKEISHSSLTIQDFIQKHEPRPITPLMKDFVSQMDSIYSPLKKVWLLL